MQAVVLAGGSMRSRTDLPSEDATRKRTQHVERSSGSRRGDLPPTLDTAIHSEALELELGKLSHL
jgi:hypothetical protein